LDARTRLHGVLSYLTGLPRTTVIGHLGRLQSRNFLPKKPKNQGVMRTKIFRNNFEVFIRKSIYETLTFSIFFPVHPES
jgi:hypothetical protein